MKHRVTAILFSLLAVCGFTATNCVSTQPEEFPVTKADNKNIEQICSVSPVACLTHIDDVLANNPSSNRIRYELLQYRFLALFHLQRMYELHNETKLWLNEPNLPIAFAITVYIYYAKTAFVYESAEVSQVYANRAMQLLKEMQEVFPSPLRLIELGNLQMQYGQTAAAYELLVDLANRYKHSKNAFFQMELHGNLGHITNKLKRLQESLNYWKSADYWGKQYGNKQQLAVIYFNTGDIYQQLADHENAIVYFTQAKVFATAANDVAKLNQALLRLSTIYTITKKHCSAYNVLQEIDVAQLPLTDTEPYRVLAQQLDAC